jgi:exopolysaccharide biosynthesis protein
MTPLQEQDKRSPDDFRKSKAHSMSVGKCMAIGFLIDILAAALLLGGFYAFEYGIPFTSEVYTVVDSTGQTQIPISSQSTTAASEDALPSEGESAESGISSGTYSSDSLQISVTVYSSGSGDKKITWYVADIRMSDLSLFKTCFAEDSYGRGIEDYVLDMAKDKDAVLAVNGDYYSQQNHNIVIRNGEVYKDDETLMDLCVLYEDGTMVTYGPGEITASGALEAGAWQAWNFGPELISEDGEVLSDFNTSDKILGVNPRTAIGYYEPGHYCLVVVDGRTEGYSIGMTMSELAQLFKDLGCKQAYNLDGGQSSVMVFQGEIVSKPWHDGRDVSDAIVIG